MFRLHRFLMVALAHTINPFIIICTITSIRTQSFSSRFADVPFNAAEVEETEKYKLYIEILNLFNNLKQTIHVIILVKEAISLTSFIFTPFKSCPVIPSIFLF